MGSTGIWRLEDDKTSELVGVLLVYVDDALVAAGYSWTVATMGLLEELWACKISGIVSPIDVQFHHKQQQNTHGLNVLPFWA